MAPESFHLARYPIFKERVLQDPCSRSLSPLAQNLLVPVSEIEGTDPIYDRPRLLVLLGLFQS